jgi:hypothetical protein
MNARLPAHLPPEHRAHAAFCSAKIDILPARICRPVCGLRQQCEMQLRTIMLFSHLLQIHSPIDK